MIKKFTQVNEQDFNSFLNWAKVNTKLKVVAHPIGDCVNYYDDGVVIAKVSFGSINEVCTEMHEIEQGYFKEFNGSERYKNTMLHMNHCKYCRILIPIPEQYCSDNCRQRYAKTVKYKSEFLSD